MSRRRIQPLYRTDTMNPPTSEPPIRRLRILHLEDNPRDAVLICDSVEAEGLDCEFQRVHERADFESALAQGGFDLVLSDYTLPSFDGLSALRLARVRCPETPFIFVSGTIGEERAVESLRNGAVDYVVKDRLQRLVPAIRRALREAQDRATRQHIEEELRQRNELFAQITQSVEDLITVLDREGRRVFVSFSYSRLFGDPAQLLGKDAFTEIHPADRERVWQAFQEALTTGKGQRVNFRFLLKDGSIRHIESQRSVIHDSDGTVTHVVVVSRDVTEQEQAVIKIREQAALLDQATDAIFVRDLEQRITYWNQGAERVYGWKPEEVLAKRASELLYRRDSPQRGDIWKTVLTKGDWMGELTHVTKEGREIKVVSRRTLLRNPTGVPVAMLDINTDITEKKELEAQFLRGQRLENIGSLAGGIAHDLNNILAPVLMATEILREQLPAGPAQQILDTVKSSALRGSDLVNQILQFARGTKGEPIVLQLRHVIRDFTALVKNTFPRTIQIQAKLPNELHLVTADTTQLHQVLLNLCVNARDAMPDGGTLTIEAANAVLDQKVFSGQPQPVSGNYVMLSVSDTGTGIPPAVQEKIFQPFFTTKDPGKGTGLGLSTVASIVRNHNGHLELASAPGQGTTFKIYLPASVQRETATAGHSPTAAPLGRGEHILLVDDELALLEMTREMLEANNYKVSSAKNGAEALSLFQQHRFDIEVIVTDLMMPGLDGPSLVRAVKEIAPEARIICVSGLASEAKLAQLNLAEVRALLRKPYLARDLLVTLREVLA